MRMSALLACLSLSMTLCLASPLTLVLPSGYAAATGTSASTVGDALASLSLAAPGVSDVPTATGFVSITSSPVYSHVLVFDGVSADVLDSLTTVKAAVSSRNTMASSCSSCISGAFAESERLADRVAFYAGDAVTVSSTSSTLGAILAPARYAADVATASADLTTCGAASADVAVLEAALPSAVSELKVVCGMASSVSKGLTLVAISSVADMTSLEGETKAAALRVADAVVAYYIAAAEKVDRSVASLVFAEERAVAIVKSTVTATSSSDSNWVYHEAADAGRRQICIWLPVLLVVVLVAAVVVTFAVGVDATKDTLLYRTTTTFH